MCLPLPLSYQYSVLLSTSQATNKVITRCPKATQTEMQAAVDSCKEAFETWSQMTTLTRQQIMFKYQALIKRDLVGGIEKLCKIS